VVVDTLKQAEDGDGYILRLYEACGNSGTVTLRFARKLQVLDTCDLMEQDNQPAPFQGNSFSFQTTPYCIHSYRIEF